MTSSPSAAARETRPPSTSTPPRGSSRPHGEAAGLLCLTDLLTSLRDEWPRLSAVDSFVEMARVLLCIERHWRERMPSETRNLTPDARLESLLEAITRYYLDDDGRSLREPRERLHGLERLLIDQFPWEERAPGLRRSDATLLPDDARTPGNDFSQILADAVAQAIRELRD